MPTNLNRRAWAVSEDKYPRLGTAADQLRFPLRSAVLAPSNHNPQPWLFRVRRNAVELYANCATASFASRLAAVSQQHSCASSGPALARLARSSASFLSR